MKLAAGYACEEAAPAAELMCHALPLPTICAISLNLFVRTLADHRA